ncbi:MAG: ASCH domain-containing protein [Smithellaceae bacterium]
MPNKMLIMSIKPEYLKKILSGIKSIELRKVKPNVSKGDLIVFYASSPQKAICGAATVLSISEDSPSAVWNAYSDKLGIEKVKYDSYFGNREKAYAIILDIVWEYLQPVHLDKLREARADFMPPQSFRYLSDSDVNMLENMNKLKSLKKRVIKNISAKERKTRVRS